MVRIKTNIGGGSLSVKAKCLNNNNKKKSTEVQSLLEENGSGQPSLCFVDTAFFVCFFVKKLGFVAALHCQMIATIFFGNKVFSS